MSNNADFNSPRSCSESRLYTGRRLRLEINREEQVNLVFGVEDTSLEHGNGEQRKTPLEKENKNNTKKKNTDENQMIKCQADSEGKLQWQVQSSDSSPDSIEEDLPPSPEDDIPVQQNLGLSRSANSPRNPACASRISLSKSLKYVQRKESSSRSPSPPSAGSKQKPNRRERSGSARNCRSGPHRSSSMPQIKACANSTRSDVGENERERETSPTETCSDDSSHYGYESNFELSDSDDLTNGNECSSEKNGKVREMIRGSPGQSATAERGREDIKSKAELNNVKQVGHENNEVQRLQQEYDNPSNEIEQLQKEKNAMSEELLRVRQQYDNASNEMQQLRQTNDNMRNEMQQLRQEKNTMNNEMNQLRQENGNMSNEILRLQQQYDNARNEMQQLGQTNNDMMNELQQLREEKNTMSNEMHQFQQDNNNVSNEMQQLQQPDNNMSNEMQQLREANYFAKRGSVVVSSEVLGNGAYATVYTGDFYGTKVAVKEFYKVIISEYYMHILRREINIASQCRHPNLLQFICATENERECLLIVTELMDINLRKLIEQRSLDYEEVKMISMDVARGLNYLHSKTPNPIIHRDVSSANVLLWVENAGIRRAKISDYGSANLMQACNTANPGGVLYAAPEAGQAQHKPKIDVYSYGVLVCEMCNSKLPDPSERKNRIKRISNVGIRNLVDSCTQKDPLERPRMQEVIGTWQNIK